MNNNIDHPAHYNMGAIEAIDVIKDNLGQAEYTGFLKGNILKYMLREKYKGGIEDLKKAQWYLDHLIHHLEDSTQ